MAFEMLVKISAKKQMRNNGSLMNASQIFFPHPTVRRNRSACAGANSKLENLQRAGGECANERIALSKPQRLHYAEWLIKSVCRRSCHTPRG